MVGVPLSKGCLLCVQRRVKCGQERPGCTRCAKYGADCPGYDRPLKFVAGKHHARPRRKHTATSDVQDAESSSLTVSASSASASASASAPGSTPSSASASSRASPAAPGPSTHSTAVVPHRVQTYPTRNGNWNGNGDGIGLTPTETSVITIPPQLTDNRAQYVYTLIETLSSGQPSEEVGYFKAWFRTVPQHLGHKVTVDSALCALALHLLGKAKSDSRALAESRSLYGQSLRALQRALNHPTEWRTSETLCAAMVLCYFELWAGTSSPAGWMAHARGVSKVIQLRGPAAYSTPLDRTMLQEFRPIIIMNSMFSEEDCFLAERQWHRLTRSLSDDPERPAEWNWALDLYFYNLARVPSILRRGDALRRAKIHGLPIDLESVPVLMRDAEAVHRDFVRWHNTLEMFMPLPVEAPAPDPETSPFDTVLVYENPWAGALHLGCKASLLILQECLTQCGHIKDFREDNKKLARHIFRSMQSVGQGMMGPFRCGFAVRIAYEFASMEVRVWAQGVLAGFETKYAATSPSDYPKPEPNQYGYE